MTHIDVFAIERRARELRAAEMRRIENLMADRLRLVAVLAGSTLLGAFESVAEALRPLFSWNPQRHA